MLRQIGRVLVGPLVEAAVLAASDAWGELPLPDDSPRVYAMGPNPDRILLFGAGAVAGVGVSSYELSFGGQLARTVSALTGRGTDVEMDGVTGRTAARAAADLAEKDLSRYDALIIHLGARDAMALRSIRAWRRDIRTLVEQLDATAPAGLTIFLLAVTPLSNTLRLKKGVVRLVNGHAAALDRESRAAAAQTRVQFLPFAPRNVPPGSRFGGASTFAAWAEPVAVGVLEALDAASHEVHEPEMGDEDLRVRSLEELVDVRGSGDDDRFDETVTTTRDLFGASGAALNFVDRESDWTYAGADVPRGVVPRAGTFSSATIESRDALVVADPRFEHNAIGAGSGGVRFYAGYPIEAPNGQRIGVLSIVDVVPRQFGDDDVSLLRELALRVQSLLWSPRPGWPAPR